MSGVRLALAAGVLAALAPGASAQIVPGWIFNATNTLRAESYSASGNRAASPYPHLGEFAFDEFAIQFRRQASPYDLWRGSFSGVVTSSPYRARDEGIVPERINLTRESGEGAIAYRAEAGDFFAFTTVRTQQRALKGAALELQPESANPNLRQSVVLFGGAAQPGWRHAQWSDDNTLGASWLVDLAQVGRFNANVLRNSRGADAALGTAERRQTVASLAGETVLQAGSWRIRFEGEAAGLRGDPEVPAADASETSDSGLFAQVSGFDGGWDWRVRGERYGRDFRPFGAVTPADRRSAEAHLGRNFADGLAIRARLQSYKDQAESANPMQTRVAGVNIGGSIAPLGATGSVDAFVQEMERENRSIDQRFSHVGVNLSRAFAAGWVGTLSALRQEARNHVNAAGSFRTTQLQAGVFAPMRLGNFAGTIGPGLLLRQVSGAGATRDWQPTLLVSLADGAHRISANFGRLDQAPRATGTTDVATTNFALDYRYRRGMHEFGVDWTAFDRSPSPGASTSAHRVGIFWTVAIDSTSAPARTGASSLVAAAPLTAAGVVRTPDLLARLAPGMDLEAAATALAQGGLGAGVREPGLAVYESRLLAELEQRQRLAIVHDAGRIERAALIVSLAQPGGGDEAGRIFERVRRTLLERFGNPAFAFEEGRFGPAFAQDVATGKLIRIMEWRTEAGILRLGIPRRLDGTARIEIHHARSFPGPRDTLWGLDAIR